MGASPHPRRGQSGLKAEGEVSNVVLPERAAALTGLQRFREARCKQAPLPNAMTISQTLANRS